MNQLESTKTHHQETIKTHQKRESGIKHKKNQLGNEQSVEPTISTVWFFKDSFTPAAGFCFYLTYLVEIQEKEIISYS